MSQVHNLQENPDKQEIRKIIIGQSLNYATQNMSGKIGVLGLPSTEWHFEKQLIEAANEKGVKLTHIVGVENGYDDSGKPFFHIVKANAPKGTTVLNMDIDEAIKNDTNCQVIWADYCGNPAEYHPERIERCYSYPHIDTFVNKVQDAVNTGNSYQYYVTFCCNGRIQGGKETLIRVMGGKNCNSMSSAIRSKISLLLSIRKLTPFVTEILRVTYHGGKLSQMVTFGFAINFKPSFPSVRKEWMERYKAMKEVQKIEQEKTRVATLAPDPAALRKQAYRDLSDKGWKSSDIAEAFNVSRMKVGAVLAHHRHPESFKK